MNKLNSKNKKQRLTLRKAKWFTQNQSNGFTIIEVVLVLAIAGLIFLIVFLALPGLQRSRRDTQRKNDVGRMIAAIISYQSNRGTLPTLPTSSVDFAKSTCTPGTDCIVQTSDIYTDPSGSAYKLSNNSSNQLSPFIQPTQIGQVAYLPGLTCSFSQNGATFSIMVRLESGGTYCKDAGA